ncbi:MAG: response regulator [Pseudomonadota bacterium]
MSAGQFRVVIADDHPIVRAGLRAALGKLDMVQVIAEASHGLEAIGLAKEHQPDLLLLDVAMPFAKGIEVVSEVKRWSPETKIVIFTGFTSAGLLREVISANVEGVFLKGGDHEELLAAIPLILSGAHVIARDVEARIAHRSEDDALTGREMQILSMIASGLGNAEIAAALNISPKTVDNHRTNLMRKLGVHTVAQLMAYALREGLLDSAKQL